MPDKKSIGRPKGATQTERLELRVPANFVEWVDEWRSEQRPIPSRSEAVRFMVMDWLIGHGVVVVEEDSSSD